MASSGFAKRAEGHARGLIIIPLVTVASVAFAQSVLAVDGFILLLVVGAGIFSFFLYVMVYRLRCPRCGSGLEMQARWGEHVRYQCSQCRFSHQTKVRMRRSGHR